jgi:hypothetical protein
MYQGLRPVLYLACEEGQRSIHGREPSTSDFEAMLWTQRMGRYQNLDREMKAGETDLKAADLEVCGV